MGERRDLHFELKAINASQRTIEGYAAATGNVDAGGDVIEPGAFRDALGGRAPGSVPVFVGHQHGSLPIGMPLEIREDVRGLFTRTRIFATAAGDDLLAVVRERQAAGNPLGMSIGYSVKDYVRDRDARGEPVRRIKALVLGEYSFVAMPANAAAHVLAVKSEAALISDAELAVMSFQMALLAEFAARERARSSR